LHLHNSWLREPAENAEFNGEPAAHAAGSLALGPPILVLLYAFNNDFRDRVAPVQCGGISIANPVNATMDVYEAFAAYH